MSSIGGKSKTEKTYRAIDMDSSSSLKDFSMDRKKYYRKYVLNEKINEKDNVSINMGKLVETLLLEPELFDEKFIMSSCVSEPTANMLLFVEALYQHTVKATDENGIITKTFEEISKDAYVDSGYKIKYEAVMSKFIGTDNEVYYEELRKMRAKDLIVVTSQDITNAERIVEELRNNPVTSSIINLVESARFSIFKQAQIEGYFIEDQHFKRLNLHLHKFKSMLDFIIIDHHERTISPYDLKCVWSVEGFYEDYYLYRRAYIQGFLYYHACQKLANDVDSEFYGYAVKPIKFVVCDSINYMNPLIFEMSEKAMLEARDGFDYKGRTYPGVIQILQDLTWALENNVWNISRENFLNKGVVTI